MKRLFTWHEALQSEERSTSTPAPESSNTTSEKPNERTSPSSPGAAAGDSRPEYKYSWDHRTILNFGQK